VCGDDTKISAIGLIRLTGMLLHPEEQSGSDFSVTSEIILIIVEFPVFKKYTCSLHGFTIHTDLSIKLKI